LVLNAFPVEERGKGLGDARRLLIARVFLSTGKSADVE
jgi:hypothetical protein